MGYSTRFTISTFGKPFSEKELNELSVLKEQAGQLNNQLKEFALAGIAEKEKRIITDPERLVEKAIGYNPFEEPCKWYTWEADMRKISKQFPNTIFLIEGEGEDSGDIWKAYFLNGKMQKAEAKITFEPFDEQKLK
jgi:hypothetical protein